MSSAHTNQPIWERIQGEDQVVVAPLSYLSSNEMRDQIFQPGFLFLPNFPLGTPLEKILDPPLHNVYALIFYGVCALQWSSVSKCIELSSVYVTFHWWWNASVNVYNVHPGVFIVIKQPCLCRCDTSSFIWSDVGTCGEYPQWFGTVKGKPSLIYLWGFRG